jgi:prepilin-type N-terminal cleavage/methylation domain-containing protein
MGISMQRTKNGFSLIEVMIAMGILGTVLIAIMTLFVWGRRNVYSGRQMSKAIAVGNRILEDIAPLTKKDIYNGAFNLADTATGQTTISILGASYTNCAIRSTSATVIPSPPTDIQSETAGGPGFLGKWKDQMGTDLANASVSVLLQPTSDPTNSPAQFGTAQVLRVRVIVQWAESAGATRRRNLVLDTVKTF